MKIDIITLFPKMFEGPFSESIVNRAREKDLVEINIHNLRNWATDKRKTVDDRPFGGGAGMVLKVEPLYKAIEELRTEESLVIYTTPQGEKLAQEMSNKFSTQNHLIIICGHYEGLDERIRENLVDVEISIGDYVLTGGELPAMVIVDSIVRLIPGVLSKEESFLNESFSDTKNKTLEHPHYTQPAKFTTSKGDVWEVPDILLSGNHYEIDNWRQEQSIKRTKCKRPDLL